MKNLLMTPAAVASDLRLTGNNYRFVQVRDLMPRMEVRGRSYFFIRAYTQELLRFLNGRQVTPELARQFNTGLMGHGVILGVPVAVNEWLTQAQHYTIGDTASALGVVQPTVQNWCREGVFGRLKEADVGGMVGLIIPTPNIRAALIYHNPLSG